MAKKPLPVDKPVTTTLVGDDEFKEHLHQQITRLVKSQTDVTLSKPAARQVFNLITELVFRRVVETGYFRFPAGYGSLKLMKLKDDAAERTMPDGSVVKPKEHRYKIKYKDGVAVMDLLGTNPHKYQRKHVRPSVVDEIADVVV